MELKEFVKTAIQDITNAVSELQSELKNGSIVSPSMPSAIANSTVMDPDNGSINRKISNIDFDVALTVGDSGTIESCGKVGIQIFSAKIGGENKSHTEDVSRITFSIPVVLPTAHVKSKQENFTKKQEQNKAKLRKKRQTINAEISKDTTKS